jgi:hypothetical protein
MCSRRLRDLKRSFAAAPFDAIVTTEKTNGGHFRAVFSTDQWTLAIIVSYSPSDWRSMRNTEAFARRQLRKRATA